jgi:hypothetical protein
VDHFGKKILAVRGPSMLPLLHELRSFQMVEDAYPFGEYHHAVLRKGGKEDLLSLLNHRNEVVVMEARPNIEDCFMSLMKEKNDG